MEKHEWLAQEFEAHRTHLQAVAYRMLGSLQEADDAVQDTWFHLSSSNTNVIENLGGWLTTVIARISLNMLRSRRSRREESLDASMQEPITSQLSVVDPEQEALLADSVGLALLVILEALSPAERLAFVLHDVFTVPFNEIAPLVERSETATRQLASRARRRIRGETRAPDADLSYQQGIVEAFLAAARAGKFEDLLVLLDPNVVYRDEWTALHTGSPEEVHGADSVAKQLLRNGKGVRPVLVNGSIGVVVAPYGRLLHVAKLTITHGKIAEINVISDPTSLSQLHLSVLPN